MTDMVWLVMAYELEIIAKRRNQINMSRAEHEAALKGFDQELAELDVAERVISRLVKDDPPIPPTPPEAPAASLTVAIDAAAGTSRKPPNIPTIPEMIMTILNNGNPLAAPRELTPKGLTEEIRRRWWPSVTPMEVSPIVWRMAKRGDLVKDGPIYRLPMPGPNGVTIIKPPKDENPPSAEMDELLK
jgi:hypothetical protein